MGSAWSSLDALGPAGGLLSRVAIIDFAIQWACFAVAALLKVCVCI